MGRLSTQKRREMERREPKYSFEIPELVLDNNNVSMGKELNNGKVEEHAVNSCEEICIDTWFKEPGYRVAKDVC